MKWPCAFLLFLCSCCGYRFAPPAQSICVPYVEGDLKGHFTSQLIYALGDSSHFCYRQGADLRLDICLYPPRDRNIGFAYAPGTNIVVSNEARLTLTARVSVVDCCTGACVFGPQEICSTLDFDFEPDLGNVNQHAFSLGQLEMHNLARDAAFNGLYPLLAQKIVDYLAFNW